MIEVIIFDFDGVIAESVDIKTKAFAELFKKEGRAVESKIVEYHLANAGVSRYDKFRYIYKNILKRDLSDKEFNALCKRFAGLAMESVVVAPYVKGATAFLKDNAEIYDYFIVTATPQEEMDAILKKRGIAGFFIGVYGAPLKKADSVRSIVDREAVAPEKVVYVGDALSDYKAAKENNVNFIARVSQGVAVFSDIECVKIKDLSHLERALGKMGLKESAK